MGFVKSVLFKSDFLLSKIITFNKPVFPYYHAVSDEELPHVRYLYKIKNIDQFKSDLDFLLKTYSVLNPDVLINSVLNNDPIPPKSFLLTFDDGLSEIYKNVIPILEQKGVPSILFINSQYIDNSELFYKHAISLAVDKINSLTSSADVILKELSSILNTSDARLETVVIKTLKIQYDETIKLKEILRILELDVNEYLKDNSPYLTTSELEDIVKKGHYLGGHSTNHFPMDKLSFENQINEVVDSVIWIKNNFDVNYEFFSFPFSDSFASERLFEQLFQKFPNLICMGNAGFRKDISNQIVQRVSFENPEYTAETIFRTNLAYFYYNKLILNGKVKR